MSAKKFGRGVNMSFLINIDKFLSDPNIYFFIFLAKNEIQILFEIQIQNTIIKSISNTNTKYIFHYTGAAGCTA